jgi:hypothetical protein
MPRRRRLALIVGALAVVTAGCGLGPRPHLLEAPSSAAVLGGGTGTPSGDAGADGVLRLLEAIPPGDFTATYHITRKLGPNETTGTVVQDGEDRSVTVGDVRFLHTSGDQTCSVSAQTCAPGTLDARISDFSIGSTFWGAGPARALRVALTRRSGPPVASTQTVAGEKAQCVDVPVGGGVEHYCATDLGPIARWDTAALSIELTGFTANADADAGAFAPAAPG